MSADLAEMEAMIAELLELERLREGRGLQRAPVDLVSLLREAAAAFEGVRLQPGEPSLVLDVDAGLLRRVLRNLLENAVKYALPDSQPVELSITREGDAVLIRVRDDGPGIPEADLPRLFEPFFRVDRSRSRRTGGYGLGLSICKRILEAHGGEIAVRNQTPRGAQFTLRLPA
jgi:signal transduction histidine kinase